MVGDKNCFKEIEFRGECTKVEVTVFYGQIQRGESPNSKVLGVNPHQNLSLFIDHADNSIGKNLMPFDQMKPFDDIFVIPISRDKNGRI